MKKILLTLILLAFGAANAEEAIFTSIEANPQKPEATVQMSVPAGQAVETRGFQTAINGLDSAQVEIRNKLVERRAKYSEVDSQFKLISQERKMLKKEIGETEKRIKEIDRAKERIRKNL